MKRNFNIAGILMISIILVSYLNIQAQTKSVSDGKYSYEFVENDPLKARIYTLDNGLKVYLTVNKSEPRIQTYIAVATGSKNDPSTSQGLSHYLEHMVFKGTDKYGTKDYEKEKPLIDMIIALYEQRRNTTDENERRLIYHKIDSVSYLASEYAIANEYDKMIADIGGKGSNAYTSVEQTVYTCEIPSNQISKWLSIEAERFRKPVMRLFHTELEAVYEEKNTVLDNDNSKVWEAFYAGLFKKHTYGTQTTIGSVEQLKNPSMQTIIDYYNERYVPNNMAICLSGDLNPDETIRLIDEKFGSMQNKPVPVFNSPVEDPIEGPEIKEVFGPSQEFVRFGYRFAGGGTKESDILVILEYILSNGTAGLIDLNLNQDQKVIEAYASTDINKDYSVLFFGGKPREGQTLIDVKDLLMKQIGILKKGEFPDWLVPAIISNFKLNQIRAFESNENRADAFVSSFVLGIPWDKYISNVERLSEITKAEVVNFANKNLNDNYVIVYKRTGEDNTIQKVEKPEINPVKVNRDDKSVFVETILNEQVADVQPVFLDYKKDIQEISLKNDIPVFYLQNIENELFELYYIVEVGTNQNRKLGLAMQYLNYLGTSKFSPAAIKEEFYKLASSFEVTVNEDQARVSLSGLNENFNRSVTLLEELFTDPVENKAALDNLVADILTQRENAKLSKNVILWSAMLNYGKYGKDNPFTYRLSEDELKKIQPSELIKIIKDIMNYKQRVLYYGPQSASTLTGDLNTYHKTSGILKTASVKNKFKEKNITDNEVYVVNYDMQQAEIVLFSKSENYDKNKIPIIELYNEYFGGGMQSIVFQELRESKALAYSTFSAYQMPNEKTKPNYIVAYIGTQADKLPEAMTGMSLLLTDMPESELNFTGSKNSLLKKIQSERVTKSNILFEYEKVKKLGLDYDIRRDVYENIPEFTFNDVRKFQNEYIKNKKYVTLVLGDLKLLDMKALEKYGKVKELSLKDVFGY
ncbi:MAG: insulinase family protein [Ignavibacteria bacterium]